jgi:hypothetical protein
MSDAPTPVTAARCDLQHLTSFGGASTYTEAFRMRERVSMSPLYRPKMSHTESHTSKATAVSSSVGIALLLQKISARLRRAACSAEECVKYSKIARNRQWCDGETRM